MAMVYTCRRRELVFVILATTVQLAFIMSLHVGLGHAAVMELVLPLETLSNPTACVTQSRDWHLLGVPPVSPSGLMRPAQDVCPATSAPSVIGTISLVAGCSVVRMVVVHHQIIYANASLTIPASSAKM